MTTRGATASAEAADVVLTSDRVDGLADAILIARRSRRIARRAAGTGMALSAAAMAFAAAGLLTPTVGAVLQEGIDIAAIAMALAVLLPGKTHTVVLSDADRAVARRLYGQHSDLAPRITQIRALAACIQAEGPVDIGIPEQRGSRALGKALPSATRSGPCIVQERSRSPIVAMRRPVPTPGWGRSMCTVSSSRTRRPAVSTAARAASSTVLPLSKNEQLVPVAEEVLGLVQPHFMTDFDVTQAIGRRYRRQDELGTPFCVTIDFDTLDDRAVTVRERDSMEQERVAVGELVAYLRERLD